MLKVGWCLHFSSLYLFSNPYFVPQEARKFCSYNLSMLTVTWVLCKVDTCSKKPIIRALCRVFRIVEIWFQNLQCVLSWSPVPCANHYTNLEYVVSKLRAIDHFISRSPHNIIVELLLQPQLMLQFLLVQNWHYHKIKEYQEITSRTLTLGVFHSLNLFHVRSNKLVVLALKYSFVFWVVIVQYFCQVKVTLLVQPNKLIKRMSNVVVSRNSRLKESGSKSENY